MSKKIKDTEFLTLTANLRAKEAKMLTRDKMERMLTEPNFADAARVLTDCGYEDMGEMNSAQINEALGRHLARAIEEFYSVVPEKSIAEMFRLKYEYHNAKVIIKNAGLSENGRRLLSPCGRTEISEIIRVYESEEPENVNKTFAEAIVEAKETLARTGNPQLSDFVLDKAYFAELLAFAKASRSEFIGDYARLLVDSANLRSTVRALLIDRRELLEKALIAGGTVDVDVFINTVQSREDVVALFTNSVFEKAAQAPSMTSFELEVDNTLTELLSRTKLIGFGPEPALAYLASLETEIMTIRIILTGKLIGIAPELLRERLRDSYV